MSAIAIRTTCALEMHTLVLGNRQINRKRTSILQTLSYASSRRMALTDFVAKNAAVSN